jgi:hypothetical protein
MACHCSKRVDFYRQTRKRRWPAEVQAAIDRFERQFGDELSNLTEAVAERFDAPGPADVETVVVDVLNDREAELATVIREGMITGVESGRRMAARRFGLEIDFSVTPQSAIDAVEATVDDIEGDIFETLSDGIQSDLEGWLEDGLSSDEIADKLRSKEYADRLDRRHTQTHARTLVQSASEKGNDTALQESSAVGKRWNVTDDGRQRQAHDAADGQIAPAAGTFLVMGERLQHPGDPNGSLSNIANCRCFETAVFESDLTDNELAQLRAGNRLNT